ncbi:coiled-coil domain-containing protein 107 [Lampris incognitus]|uniref:coiled-coil domain-containing protein 107 n=1 Tax=Lampris incognitus TaxID=2546036 RepID=UPI0024B5E4BA|nr:coiled-coil domain-containing protein 107 [Lampris incognitus]
MVPTTSQQVVVVFTVLLFTFVVLPRMFGVGTGTGPKETRGFDPRYNRKVGPGPGAVRGQPVSMNAPGSPQTVENMQQMKMMMEQEMKSEKYKSNSNKGYVFTLMPLYAVGVGVFAAYKFMKIKSADESQGQKNKVTTGARKSAEAENQLNELEQRLAQTERMLNSILTQLDPLTNCVKSVAQEQKNEIMSQLQTIRYLMKKRGMDWPPINIPDPSCQRNLDSLIESLAAHDSAAMPDASAVGHNCEGTAKGLEPAPAEHLEVEDEEGIGEETLVEFDGEEKEDGDMEEDEDEGLEESELVPSLEEHSEVAVEELGAGGHEEELPMSGLRRRNRPE